MDNGDQVYGDTPTLTLTLPLTLNLNLNLNLTLTLTLTLILSLTLALALALTLTIIRAGAEHFSIAMGVAQAGGHLLGAVQALGVTLRLHLRDA